MGGPVSDSVVYSLMYITAGRSVLKSLVWYIGMVFCGGDNAMAVTVPLSDAQLLCYIFRLEITQAIHWHNIKTLTKQGEPN